MGQTRIYLGADNDHEAVAAADTYNFLLLEDDMLVSWGGGIICGWGISPGGCSGAPEFGFGVSIKTSFP